MSLEFKAIGGGVLSIALSACLASGNSSAPGDAGVSTSDGSTSSDHDGGPVQDAAVPQLTESEFPRVKLKSVDVLRTDLSDALGIPADRLCKELDRYDCFDAVHKIPLGGVEPYELGIYTPLPESAATSPIAVDRVVLAACRERVDRDIAGDIVIFDLPPDGAALTATSTKAAEESLDRLYKGVLRRRPEARELEHLMKLYDDVGGEPKPSRAWAILACFAVATSKESLFY
ncbi:MAG: hypothetical protein HY791_19060 [Deltaproteobacteria bacterium]|nr:hypothetical protein [Deltaproteobacteria bacterium]